MFTRGGGAPVKAERAADLSALLRTYARLMGPTAEQDKEEVYRPRLHPLWRVPDALARMEALLPELLVAAAPGGDRDGASLWSFLPGPEALAAAELGPDDAMPDPAPLLCRSAVASTLVAGLELAHQGLVTLAQEQSFGTVLVHGAPRPRPAATT